RLVSRDIPILRLEGDSRSTAARAIDAGDVWLAAAVDGRDAPILVLSAPASVADVAARRFDEVLDAVRFEVAPSADQTASTWLRVLLVAGCIAVGSAGAISRRWKVVRARLESSLLSLLPRAGSQRSQPAWDSVS
ncbi:MAG TPA: hypothetical protein VK116_17770, partial [Planctomycetota bacterium]|nr:hypothetical protein [Planctomycetota bacterium]